ncbi:MAG TPA: hypothetical protein VKZ53_04890 [Candidatus Angelobacter sp.]|nr:hypothetical protein [Candidatus Angelobacter sp.]
MRFRLTTTLIAILPLLAAGSLVLRAQEIKIAGRPLEVHGSFSQGFMYTNQNNYLTDNTTSGSFGLTDGSLNLNYQIFNKLRVGAQVYDRKIGAIGRGTVQLDWALVDYRMKDWMGFRAGKVKTVLGLYNDTQDSEFLHTWALLPQSIYPVDLRESYIAHTGGDIYGDIPLKKLGTLSYTAYAGQRPNDLTGGYAYALGAYVPTIHVTSYTGLQVGQDVRWATPVSGLLLGASHQSQDVNGKGIMFNWAVLGIPDGSPFREGTVRDFTNQFYVQYQHRKLRIDGEYRRYWRNHSLYFNNATTPFNIASDSRSWYIAGAYRLHKRLEVGAYHSRYYADWNQTHNFRVETFTGSGDPPDNHIFDWTLTARVDLASYWNVKIEGHFMDGYGSPDSVHGFYQPQNPNGFQRTTNLLVVRTGFNF